jgi:hypothetical protein
VRIRGALFLLPVLIAACGQTSPSWSDKNYQALQSSFVVPSGFTPASPAGPCQIDPHMQCWTTTALPTEAVNATVQGLGSGYRTTDAAWCGMEHWAAQRKAWGEAHTPCTLHGTSHHLRLVIAAIAFPDRKTSASGRLVFPPTLVSIAALPP